MNSTIKAITIAGALLASTITLAAAPGAGLPQRPEEIKFRPLEYQPPNAADSRHTLSNGVTVYMIETHEFPLINITFSFKGGDYLEPAGKAGLGLMTGAMMRRGGTTSIKAQDLDEKLDFLAAQAGTNIGDSASTATLSSLKANLDESFSLFMDIVRNPGFQEDKVRVFRDEQLEQMKQRNDDADNIMARERDALVWGRDFFEARVPTKASLESITIDDMKAFHNQIFHPGNLIVGVTGDFDPKDMLARLESAFAGWNKGQTIPDPPDTAHTITPGLYYVEKDIPQGKIAVVKRSLKRDDPDTYAVQILNEILGAGGFTSRLVKRIRSDEGLSYGAGSSFGTRVYYPGELRLTASPRTAPSRWSRA